MTPSITCTDPLSNEDNCSCTCTDGLKFKQPPPSSSQAVGSGPALAVCEAGKNESLKREQDLMDQLNAKQQELLKREQEWTTQLSEKEQERLQREQEISKELKNCGSMFRYMGCYINPPEGLIIGTAVLETTNTMEKCASRCRDYMYFALSRGNTCGCANVLRDGSTPVPEAECSTKCAGNSNQSCGAEWRANLYAKRV